MKDSRKPKNEVDGDYFKKKRQEKNKALNLRRKRREKISIKESAKT